ncbi:MAG TPA: SDR family oxidoreductase [Planctomycetota bacterium]|jgi:3-oxoacyl-[acyl-carrier protein] reductase|nr:SDR family oxidoreductase [Planctomycetota bacterium]
MDFAIRDRVAVVLAASKGMGFAVASGLAREGCRVAMCARRKPDLERAARVIEDDTGRPVFRRALDVTKRASIRPFLAAVEREAGPPDILIVNSGGPPPGTALEVRDRDVDGSVRSTLLVAVDWMRAVAPGMIRRKWGRIVAIESTSIKAPIDTLALSNTMRAGVAGFAKSLAREVAPHGVTVNVLCPGMIRTDRLKALAEGRAKKARTTVEEIFRRMAAEIPVGRIGTPEEFAAAAVFLASVPARYITGTVIQVDGGAYRGLL